MKAKATVQKIFSLILIAACYILITVQPVAAQASGIGGRPANPDPNNERTKSIFVKQLAPGQSTTDAVKIINSSDGTKTIAVYATDSVPSSDGAFACAQAADTAKQVGNWITLGTNSVTLAPGQSQDVSFTITTPSNASVGEQNGCIVIQEQKDATVQSGIGLSFRTAIRVAVLVPGEIQKSLSAVGIELSKADNKISVSPIVKNTGNVSLDTSVETKFTSFFGTTIAKRQSQFPVLRDQETKWNLEFNKPFWGGFYKASYSLTYNDDTSQYLGAHNSHEKVVEGPSKSVFVMPAPGALVIELAILGFIIFLIILTHRRRLQHKSIKDKWKPYTVKADDNIQTIAKTYHISWRKLAASNNLKPPFTLEPGDVIKTPPHSKTTKPTHTKG